MNTNNTNPEQLDLIAANEIVRRPNETLAVLPKTGKISAVMRRIFVAALYHSQKQGDQQTYRAPLADIMRSAQFTSRNTAEMKDQLRALRSNEVEWNVTAGDVKEWGVSGMLKEVRLIEEKGHPTMLEWELPTKVREQLLDPTSYTALRLQIYSSLRTGSSIALYGICSRYATNPGRLTLRAHWDWWRPRLTGNPDAEANLEYKYFKRDVLKPSIAEINTVCEFTVTLIEHRNGKSIEDIQFRVDPKTQPAEDPSTPAPDFDAELLEQIMRLGIKEKPAREIYASHPAEYLRKTIILTEQRAAAPGEPLRSKAGYFRKALAERYADAGATDKPKAPAAAPVDTVEAKKERARALLQAERSKDAYELYKELDTDQQAAMREDFRQATTVAQFKTEIKKHGLARSAALRSAFCEWYADQVWGKATEQDLINFMLKHANV